MNDIIRQLAPGLGFDKYGQLNVQWDQDGSTCSTFIADMRGKKCGLCGQEWRVTAESFRNQMKINTTEEWCHRTCMAGHVALNEADLFYRALCDARGEASIAWQWTKVPNEYGGAWNTPWYVVRFKGYLPKVKIGCRKRVYALSMFDLRPEQVAMFLPLVKNEDVTKGTENHSSIYIHAWTTEKVLEYLRHFYAILQTDSPLEDAKGAIITDLKLAPK